MPRFLPQRLFKERGRDDFPESKVCVLGAKERREFLEYVGAIWLEEWGARARDIREKE